MKFSVITATKNSGKTISRCCHSLTSQTFQDWEHLVVDANSHDSTIHIVKELSPKSRVIYQEGFGIYAAFNIGIRAAKGDWVIFLNSDDYFVDSRVLEDIARLTHGLDESHALMYGAVRRWVVNFSGGYIGLLEQPEFYTKLLSKLYIMPPHPGTFYNRRLLGEELIFNQRFSIISDAILNKKISEQPNVEMRYTSRLISHMQGGGVSNQGYKSKKTIVSEISEHRASILTASFINLSMRYVYKLLSMRIILQFYGKV